MKTLLVLAELPEMAEVIRSGLNPEQYRVTHRATVDEAEPMLVHNLADACILDLEMNGVQSSWVLERLRRRAPRCPLIVYASAKQPDWEEEAYLHGVTHVLSKPVRPRMLAALLGRIWATPSNSPVPSNLLAPSSSEALVPASAGLPQPASNRVGDTTFITSSSQTLGVLRNFSGILSHSLDAEGLLKQFLLLLRELLGVNRAAVFLPPATQLDEGAWTRGGRRLQAVCAVGLPAGLLQHFELSFEAGIGASLFRSGRILRRLSDEARGDVAMQKEFELLGAQVAVPILDRETVLGVVVFDGRITGEPLLNAELELIFRLLEQVGLALRNIWLHEQATANQRMLADILRELSDACVVVGRDLHILHANKAARKFFSRNDRQNSELEFTDLPQALGAKVYQVLQSGAAITNLRFEPDKTPGAIYQVSIVPFQRSQPGQPGSVLVMAEDLSHTEQLQRLEVETANLRLVQAMADRLMHEIGNAMVPLSTHQQLLADKWKDPEFRASMDAALADGVKRVTRLINQMRFLARDALVSPDAFPLAPLIDEAFQEARKHQPVKAAQLKYESGGAPIVLKGDRAALKHAFAEVMLNALQANPADPRIGVRLQAESGVSGRGDLQIEVQDNGSGFSPEAVEKAPAPFFTTRNVGLGLGLTVSRKIIETHHGKLEILNPESGKAGVVRISLPWETSSKS